VRILVIHGPNLNLLGIREPEVYGTTRLQEINRSLRDRAEDLGVQVSDFQSNHEGDIIDRIQAAALDVPRADGIILNPAGYTHTSVAIRDALIAVSIPTWEIHISDPATREKFRHVSLVRDIAVGFTAGKGSDGYLEALDGLVAHLRGEGDAGGGEESTS
jgi:3-dehydroquinate dehydratase type II